MSMAACSQCGKPAVVGVGDNPLCVNCLYKFQQAILMRDRMLKEEVNFLIGQMEAVSSIYGLFPRYALPEPVIHQGPMNFHNIKVDSMPKESRSWGILKALVTNIGTQVATTGLAVLWDAIRPMLGL